MDTAISQRYQLAGGLLAVQAAITAVSGVEAALMAAGTGNAAGMGPVIVSFGWGVLLLAAGRKVVAGKGRRLVKWIEGSVLVWSSINLALAVILVGTGTGLMAATSGFVLPLVVLYLILRKEGS